MRQRIYTFSWLKLSTIIFLIISGCTPNNAARHDTFKSIALENNFTETTLKAGDFHLLIFQKISNPNLPYVFYLEGDGLVVKNRSTISDDPTPITPMLFKLATYDTRPNVVYIARPCQFTSLALSELCSGPSFWLQKRLAQEVVSSIKTAIDQISHGQKFHLVGFSGGGGVAVLIAAQEPQKVIDIITIAGNLDLTSFNQYHNTSPMVGSLNPRDYTSQVSQIPQLHFVSSNDKSVPPIIAENYLKATNFRCATIKTIPNATHLAGWGESWKEQITRQVIKCY